MTSPTALARLSPSSSASYGLLAVAANGRDLVPTSRPDVATADGYLRITAHVLLESQRSGFTTVGVFSSVNGEGKTAAAVNLAVCLGRARGRQGRVLLVDADARNRALSRLFCGPDGGGAGGGSGGRHPTLIGTALDGVDLMTAPSQEDGLTVTSPDAWATTFRELGETYPHIVVDCPPVLDDPEGLVLREVVDRLVLVVRAGVGRKQFERALGTFASRVIGVIVNGAVPAGRGWEGSPA